MEKKGKQSFCFDAFSRQKGYSPNTGRYMTDNDKKGVYMRWCLSIRLGHDKRDSDKERMQRVLRVVLCAGDGR